MASEFTLKFLIAMKIRIALRGVEQAKIPLLCSDLG